MATTHLLCAVLVSVAFGGISPSVALLLDTEDDDSTAIGSGAVDTSSTPDSAEHEATTTTVAPAKGADFVFAKRVQVLPYGVMGKQLASVLPQSRHPQSTSFAITQSGPVPDDDTVILDPLSLSSLQHYGPKGAQGVSKAIYKWIGINGWSVFEEPFRQALSGETKAKLIEYGPKDVIHAICPDLNDKRYAAVAVNDEDARRSSERAKAVEVLAETYCNVFKEFLKSDRVKLRFQPVSVQQNFLRLYHSDMPDTTREAIDAAFARLPAAEQDALLQREVMLCVYEGADYNRFRRAMQADDEPPKSLPE